MAESCPMKGGDGPQSYAQNSSYQKGGINAVKDLIREAITRDSDLKDLCTNSKGSFSIADLGCSTGPNTFISMQNIIDSVKLIHHHHQIPCNLEFQAFFNDQVNNDFNTLFRTIPPSREYYPVGVPGSFHGRLFPKHTIHFAFSSYTLHWLSEVPKQILDISSAAWNGDSIQCTGTAKQVSDAYFDQFSKDIDNFLNARGQEIIPGGLVVILMMVLPNGVSPVQTIGGVHLEFLGSCLNEMAKMGKVSQEKVKTFNLPMYFPSIKEMEAVVEKNGCFKIERSEALANPMELSQSVSFCVSMFRAIFEEVVKKHFGEEIIEELFGLHAKKLEDNYLTAFDISLPMYLDLVLVLKRKLD